MVERVGLYTNPLLEVEGDPYAGTVNPYTGVNPAAQSGLDALRSGLVDQAVSLDQPVERSRFQMAGGLSTPPSEFGMAELEAFQRSTTPLEFAQMFQAPQQAQPTQGIRLGFDPDQGKYLINNTVVDTRDIQGLQRVPELIQEPLSPELPAGNWRPIDIQTLKRNKDELLTLSFGERVGLGAQQVAGSIPTGFGRLAEFAGAEGVGEALVGLGEQLSPDEFDEARLAAITESENIVQSIVGAVPQGIPSVVTSVGGAIVGGLAGGFLAGGPIGATIGALIGGASTIFPMMVDSAYDTALRQQGEDFVESDRGKAEILGTAFATTGIQMIPGMQVSGRVVPMLMQRAATQVANKATSGVAGTAAKVGFAEGMAEMMALVTEQVAFDPETRAMMSEGEVAAMLPYVAETYGREAAVAFSAGAILGGGVGAVTGAITRQAEDTSAEPSEGDNLLVPTDEAPSGPEFTGRMRGVGPQGVLPMEGLGGQIERARRSRQVGYQPPKEGEQSNLLERPAPVADEAQLDLGFAEEVEITEPVRPTAIEEQLRPQLRQREFEQAQAQRRAREEAAAEAQRQQQIADEARVPPVDLRRGPRIPGEAVPQQAPLFTRRQAPALSRGEQLRRGIQQPPTTVPDIDQIAPVVRPPAQQELFTRRGLPTAAARVSPEVAVEPGVVFGTVAGAPFRSEVSALGQRQRVSRDTGIPATELEVVETDQGFFVTRAEEEAVAPEAATGPAGSLLDTSQYVYHVVRNDSDIDDIMQNGLNPGTNISGSLGGQAFSGEGDTILVLRREDVKPRDKDYQADSLTTSAARPVAIIKDTSVEARPSTKSEIEDRAIAAQEQLDSLVVYAQTEYGLSEQDVMRYASGIKSTSEAPVEAQSLMKRLRVLSNRIDTLLDRAEAASDTVVSADEVLARYTQYGLPVQQVVITPADDGAQTVTLGRKAQTQEQEDAIQEPSPAEVPARERAGVSEEVGARVPSVAEPARAREEEAIIQQAQEGVRQQDVRETLTPPLSPAQQNRLRRQRREGLVEAEAEPAPRTPTSAWEFLKPEGASEFVSLRPALQDIWRQAFEQNVMTAELAGQINRLSVTPSNMQEGLPTLVVDDTGVARIESVLESEYREATLDDHVNELVDSLDVVRDITKPTYDRGVYINTIAELIDALHLPTGVSVLKAATRTRVEKALTGLSLSDIFKAGMGRFASNLTGPIDAQRIPFIVDRMNEMGLIKEFNNLYGFINLPEDLQVPVDKIPVDPTTGEQLSTKDPQADALALELNINLYNNEEFARNPAGVAKAEQKLIELYERVVDEGLQDFIDARGNPLSAYFNEDGTPKLVQRDGRTRVVTDETAPARRMTEPVDPTDWNGEIDPDVARIEAMDEEAARPVAGGPTAGTGEVDFISGAFSTADGTPITKPMEIGRVRMLVNTFKNKLRVKPKTFVFRTQADLQAKDPALYARAVAARPQGDFDTKVAAGYSFGSGDDATVIIFSDRIRGNQHLNFVLAHETIGHFGMRSLLSQARFNSVMEGLYEDSGVDTNLRFEVDAAMEANPDLSRAQAVEEYLADFAGRLDTSIVLRVYNAIKGVLNRLGVQFSDDAARYLIGHARDYVRLGEVSSMFDAAKVATRIQELNGGMDPDGTGRFSSANTVGMLHAVAAFVQAPRWGEAGRALASGDHHEAAKAAMDAVRKTGINVKSDWEGIKRQLWRLSTYVKRENPGLEKVFELFDRGTKESYRIQNDFNERLKLVFDRSMFDKVADLPAVGGATSTQIDSINENLYGSLMKNRNNYTPTMLGVEPLYTILDGEYIKNTPEINRLFDLGTLSFEEMRDGYSYQLTDGTVREVKGIPDLTRDDIRYRGYMDVMEALRDLQLEKVRASMQAAVSAENDIFGRLDSIMQSGQLEPQQRQFLESMHRIFVETYYADPEFITGEDGVAVEIENVASMQSANDFLVALNTALIAEKPAATDRIAAERNAEVIAALRNTGRDIDANTEAEILQNIEDFKTARVSRANLEADEKLYAIQTAFKAAQAINGEVENVMKTAKRNIAVGYVPFKRRGDYEMAVEFYDRNGNKVFLTQEFKDSVVYRQFETEGEAVTVTNKVNEMFKGVYTKALIKNSDEAIEKGEDPIIEADVTGRAVARKTLDTVAAPNGLDLAAVTTFLHRFSIGLPPAKMTEIIENLTTKDAAILNKLQAQGTPGYDPNAIRAMAEFIRKESSAIVKIRMRPELNRILDQSNPESMKLWRGDPAKLERLRTTWETLRDDPTATKQAKQIAEREYYQYNYQYNKTNPPRKDGEQQRADQWKGYYNEAQTLVQFLNNNQNLNESDFGDSKYIALLRASTSIAMLGFSVATASLNFIALPTNFIPYMAAKNSDTGFGGGFNGTDVIRELTIALKQVGTLRNRSAEYYDNLAASGQAALDKAGLTIDEALFMAREIRSGVAIPAQANQLQQTALDKITSAFWQKFWQGYMWTFNSSERSSRRAAVLTAYRMERNRRLEAGYSPEQAQELARVFAEDAIDLTLGNYATYVRPKFFRDGPAGLLFIFNTFPFMSIQTLSHLPRDGKIKMLAALLVFSGVSGFPFAQDLEDIIDTIAQKLGLPMGSIRAEVAKLSDAIIPGSSRFVLNGLMRDLIPADVSGRTSLGDVAPATGIGLPGSSAIREVTDLLGPAASMIQGVFATTSTLAKATYRPEVTFNDALRISPVTAFRLVGDSWSYYNTGAITDRRGYIVSPEMNAGIILTRLLGFYPKAAAEQYQTIMVAKRITDYQRQISAGFRIGWVKAKMAGDERRARAIMDAARDWNKSNKDMQVNIKGWSRALSEARRPAVQRQLRSAPVSARQNLEQTGRLLLSD